MILNKPSLILVLTFQKTNLLTKEGVGMKRCEVCGSVEQSKDNEMEMKQSQFLHVCESCQNDRKHDSFDPEE
jgi:hypothetical protein